MTADVVVTFEDCRSLRLCARGCRAWFATNGLDWTAFLQNGLPASELRKTGDHLCEQVIEEAERRARHAD